MARKKKKVTKKRKSTKRKAPARRPSKEPLIVKVSASGVPRFFSCASSAVVIDAPFNPGSVAANIGNATHEGCWRLVRGMPVDTEELAERFNLDDADKIDFRVCMAYANQAWHASKQSFPNPKTEIRIESDLVNGTADVLHHDGETAAVGDWKSGRVPSHVTEQLAAYAYAVREKFGMPRSGYITSIAWWLRFQEMEVRKMDDNYLDAFADTFQHQMKAAGRQYAPSYDTCGFCTRQNECQALRDWIDAAGSAVMIHQEQAQAGALTIEQLGELYPQAKMLEKALAAYKEALKHAASRGEVRVGEGKVFRVNEYRKDVINDIQGAWKHLVQDQSFTPSDMASVCKLSLSKIKDIAGNRAEPQGKAKAKKQILEDLNQAGCISSIPYTRGMVVKG